MEFEVDQQNIVNSLIVKRRLQMDGPWSIPIRRPITFPVSVNLYGSAARRGRATGLLYGCAWARVGAGLLSALRVSPGIVRFTVRGLGHLTDLPGTYIGFLNPWFGWTQPRLLKVLNHEEDANDGSPEHPFRVF